MPMKHAGQSRCKCMQRFQLQNIVSQRRTSESAQLLRGLNTLVCPLLQVDTYTIGSSCVKMGERRVIIRACPVREHPTTASIIPSA
jgi:hypothetical protein